MFDSAAPKTRRVILASAVGGAAALAVSALGGPEIASAHDPDDVALGQLNHATSTTGFETATTGTAAVQGNATATTDQGVGVWGESASPEGTGVYGRAIATSGGATGVSGETASPDGTGVSGSSTSLDGGTGVHGESAAAGGVGVFGTATNTSDNGAGVFGITEATEGTGVRGRADATSGATYGVYGETFSPDGTAVYGDSQAATGGTGVAGWCDTDDGVGVSGYAGRRGVEGNSQAGTGVYGHSGGMTGVLGFAGMIDMGVPGPGPVAKTGVFGYSDLDAASVGVLGKSPAGKGVRGEATSGIGGSFASTTGIALDVSGKARFSRAKRVSIPAGASSLHVTLAGVTSSSLVFANLQTNRAGYYVGAIVPTTGAFTIYLNKTLASATYVAYFVVN